MTKLDFSQAKVQAVGTAFWAMSANVNTKTKQQLEEEESIGQTSDTSKTSNTQKPNDKTISPNDNEQTVIFADPTNGNLVKLNLSNKNIEKLKSHFSNEDFYERKDKTLRLNGEAEAYVSGWFGDIAYKREFLKADADNDGKLSEGEYQNTRNGYLTIGEAKGIGNKVLSVTETVTETYTTPHTKRPEQGESVEAMLDFTLNADKNQDGQLSNMEYLESIGGYRNLLIDNARKHLDNINQDDSPFADKTAETIKLLLEKSNNKEAQRATQKLLASNGNENLLTAEEREALGTELSIIKQSFKRKKELQEVKDEVVSKTEETRFLDTVG